MDIAGGTTQDITEGLNLSAGPGAVINNITPVRPGNLQLDGSRALGQVINDAVDRTLTWNPRQHSPDAITLETEAAEVPDQNERYDIAVFINGVQDFTLSGSVGVGVTSYVIPFSATSIQSTDVEIRVTAVYDSGAVSATAYTFLPIELDQP
jgi:hypothetical protein